MVGFEPTKTDLFSYAAIRNGIDFRQFVHIFKCIIPYKYSK